MKATPVSRRLALIDRDGTIIVDKVYFRDPTESSLRPAQLKACDSSGTQGSHWS
jgi:histidinol phosphatase-like enzyme